MNVNNNNNNDNDNNTSLIKIADHNENLATTISEEEKKIVLM